MKDFFLKIAATLVTAAVIFTATALWSINVRLTKIETVLSIKNSTASISHE